MANLASTLAGYSSAQQAAESAALRVRIVGFIAELRASLIGLARDEGKTSYAFTLPDDLNIDSTGLAIVKFCGEEGLRLAISRPGPVYTISWQ